jgi:hypothetical protein
MPGSLSTVQQPAGNNFKSYYPTDSQLGWRARRSSKAFRAPPWKGGIRIRQLRRSGMTNTLRQPRAALAAKAPHAWHQSAAWIGKRRRLPGKPKRMPFRAERRNGLAERPRNTMAGRAGEAVQPEAVPDSRRAGEDAVPSRVPGQMCRKGRDFEDGSRGCLHRKGWHRAPDSGQRESPGKRGHRETYDVDVVISGARERSSAMTEPTRRTSHSTPTVSQLIREFFSHRVFLDNQAVGRMCFV